MRSSAGAAVLDRLLGMLAVAALLAAAPPRALAGPAGGQAAPPGPTPQPAVGPIALPTVVVTAQKQPADAQTLPLSLTAVSGETLASAGITAIGEAAIYAPNTYFSELTARKISNPLFRGIGSSPANPGITSYFDGVPQLNTNSSSVMLMDVEQVEFVRGPQSALFGRNSLGGLINVTSARPSLTAWTGSLTVPLGSRAARDVRGSISGPLVAGRLGLGLSMAYERRDGFTRNDVTGADLDRRSAFSGKGQLHWAPSGIWEARLIVTGEHARDGDYALNDLGALRETPFHAARDFEGHTDRDILATTILTRREGRGVSFSTTTGLVRWKTVDATDLDYTPVPLVRRDNTERDLQFTQEVRMASAPGAPVALSDAVSLRWQGGVFLFTQDYRQNAVNDFAPFLLSQFLGFPVSQTSPRSTLEDWGAGLYGQATATVKRSVDLAVGVRLDHEQKEAVLDTFFSPPIAPQTHVTAERGFSDVSPQVSVAYRMRPERMVYTVVGRGFKAGGFNPASPAGSEAYGEERAWHAEWGFKGSWAGGRVTTNLSAFSIDWSRLQLNLPNPTRPEQFYIANVGGATSRGVEFELAGRLDAGLDVFGSFGYAHARFDKGSSSSGGDLSGNRLPNTPDYTGMAGAQWSRDLASGATVYGRGDIVVYGAFRYDDANRAGQDAYSLTNLRGGVRVGHFLGELWIRNAFDTRYVPIAFAYPGFTPSGFLGEVGRPRTFGVTAGVTF